jgi:prolyl-tRNA synthetase
MDETQQTSKSALKKAEKAAKMAAAKAEKAAKATTLPVVGGASGSKKGDDSKELIGITVSKEANFGQWYQELVVKAELVDYYTEVKRISLPSPS